MNRFLSSYSHLIGNKEYFERIIHQLQGILEINHKILPAAKDIFKAFHLCPYKDLRVVIIGQDPYPQKGYATGLAFANPKDIPVLSPSLELIMERIYKDFYQQTELGISEIHSMEDFRPFFDITLEKWAKQGVLLLNSYLTVKEGQIGSHSSIWYPFMKDFLYNLSMDTCGLIFVLFGENARQFKPFILGGSKSHYIFSYKHPAYCARNNMPLECDAFVRINEILHKNNNLKINWV